MCLIKNAPATKKLARRKKNVLQVWKVLEICNGKLYAPFTRGVEKRYVYQAGLNKPREAKLDERAGQIFGGALHVCLVESEAENLRYGLRSHKPFSHFVIVPAYVFTEDLVGTNRLMLEAAFTEVYIAQSDYGKVMSDVSNYQ